MRRCFFLLGWFLLALCQSSFAGVLEKEFSFDLALGEASKTSEITVDFPSTETGRFTGRDFKPLVTDSETALHVLSENLTATAYHAKIRILSTSQTPKNRSAKLLVTLQTGSVLPSDIPRRPDMVGWTFGATQTLKWRGQGDIKGSLPTSARYLYYQVQDPISSDTVDARVVPVWLEGLTFPFSAPLQASQTYILTVRFSNTSGQCSPPLIIKMGRDAKPLLF